MNTPNKTQVKAPADICDISEHQRIQDELQLSRYQLQKKNWAVLAYAHAAISLSRANDEEQLISGVCAAIVKEAPYVIAWVGIAQDDDKKTVKVAGMEGSARAYAEGITVSWSEMSLLEKVL